MVDLAVVSKTKEEYGDTFYRDLMDQYKLTRATITDLQNDRNTNNRFLIGICTALLGFEGFLLRQILIDSEDNHILMAVASSIVPTLGAYISHLWINWGKSYAVALRMRYKILKGMEAHFPSQPFTREFILRSEEGYIPISDITINLSKFFLIGFILLFLFSFGRIFF